MTTPPLPAPKINQGWECSSVWSACLEVQALGRGEQASNGAISEEACRKKGSALSANVALCLVGHLIPARLGQLAALVGIFFRKIQEFTVLYNPTR